MKTFEIGKLAASVYRIREGLGDQDSSVGRIKRPLVCDKCARIGGESQKPCKHCDYGHVAIMKRYLFDRRIARLREQEKKLYKLLAKELSIIGNE